MRPSTPNQVTRAQYSNRKPRTVFTVVRHRSARARQAATRRQCGSHARAVTTRSDQSRTETGPAAPAPLAFGVHRCLQRVPLLFRTSTFSCHVFFFTIFYCDVQSRRQYLRKSLHPELDTLLWTNITNEIELKLHFCLLLWTQAITEVSNRHQIFMLLTKLDSYWWIRLPWYESISTQT